VTSEETETLNKLSIKFDNFSQNTCLSFAADANFKNMRVSQ
jgi:hypothetical protein